MRLPLLKLSLVGCAVVLAAPLRAQPSPDAASAATVASIPRAQRPVVTVSSFAFTATPGKDDLEELNSLGGAIWAFKGGDPSARQKQTQDNLGKAAAGIMMERLMASGNFRVVERSALDQVKNEQGLVASDAAAPGQAVAQQAKLLGAKYVITGQITKFGKSQKKKGSLLGLATKVAVGVALESKQTSYTIGIAVRVVEASTGEVVSSFTSDGVVVGDKSRMLAGLGGGGGIGLGGAGGSSATGEREAKIAESIQVAVDLLVIQLVSARERGDLVP